MEWTLGIIAALYFSILRRLFPGLFAPRCPLCGALLQATITDESRHIWRRWHVGFRKFSCGSCLYYHKRPFVYRSLESSVGEPRLVH
jgi:hypothetical protein